MSGPTDLLGLFLAMGDGPAARLRALEPKVVELPGLVAELRARAVLTVHHQPPPAPTWAAADPDQRLLLALGLAPAALEAALEGAEPAELPTLFEVCALVARYEPGRVPALDLRMRAAMRRAPAKAPARVHAQVFEAGLKGAGWSPGAAPPAWARESLREVVAFILEESRSPHMLAVAAHGRLCQRPGSGLAELLAEVLCELRDDAARPATLRQLARQLSPRPAP